MNLKRNQLPHIIYGVLFILLAANLSVEISPFASKMQMFGEAETLKPQSEQRETAEDSLVLIHSSHSEEVIVGMPYQAEFTIARIPKGITAEYTSTMGSLSSENGGKSAQLMINTEGDMIAEGESQVRQFFETTVEVILPDGSTQQLKAENKFTVKQPAIEVTSPVVQTLYRNCGNAVHINAPELGDFYNPVITSEQAWTTPSVQDKRKYLIVPGESPAVVLHIASRINDQVVELGEKRFQVINSPKPGLEVSLAGGEAYQAGQTLKNGASVNIDALADKEFSYGLPRDARYSIGAIEIYTQDETGLFNTKIGEDIPETEFVSDRKVEMPDEVYKLPKGTWVMYRVIEVKRTNFRGQQIIEDRFTDQERSFLFIKG